MIDSQDNQVRDTLVIVRSVGERTTDACIRAVRTQVMPRQLRMLSVKPVGAADMQGFRTAAREQPAWVFTVDADTVVVDDAIARLRMLCDTVEPEVFHVQGLVLCRVEGGVFPRGLHAYRGSMLARALGHFNALGGDDRCAASVVRAMESDGHPSRCFGEVVGVHGHDQRFSDLFLKLRRRAQRPSDLDRLRSRLRSVTNLHDDFRAASWGLDDGISHPEEGDDEALERFASRCAEAELREPGPLAISDPSAHAAAIIEAHRPGAQDLAHPEFAFAGDCRRWALSPLAKADPKCASRVSPWMPREGARAVVA